MENIRLADEKPIKNMDEHFTIFFSWNKGRLHLRFFSSEPHPGSGSSARDSGPPQIGPSSLLDHQIEIEIIFKYLSCLKVDDQTLTREAQVN